MTISLPIQDILPRIQYVSGVLQTNFNIPFYLFAIGDISVYKTPVGNIPNDNRDILTLGVDYTVILNGGDVGGTVILTVGAAVGTLITLVRTMSDERLNFYRTGGTFSIPMLNPDFESLVLMLQQAKLYDQRYSLRYQFVTNPQIPDDGPTFFGRDLLLPVLGAGQGWVKDLANQEIIAATIPFIPPGEDFVTFVPPSNPLAMTRWNNNDGLLESTGVICDVLDNLSGINSARIGNILLSQSSIAPIAGNSLLCQADWNITLGNQLKLLNVANTFSTTLQAPALAQDINYTMPLLPPINGSFLSSTAAGVWSWVVPPPPGGDVGGPGASTDRALVRWNGLTGTLVLDSGVILSDANAMSGLSSISLLGNGGLSTTLVSSNGLLGNLQWRLPNLPAGTVSGSVWSTDFAGTLSVATGGLNCVVTVVQAAHGFVPGQIVRTNGVGVYALAQANTLANSEAVGMVKRVISAGIFEILVNGYFINIGPVLLANTTYYLSPTVAGTLTNIRPVGVGQVVKPILNTTTVLAGFVNIQFGFLIQPGGGNVGGPGASTDRALARWNGITGTALFDSNTILDDANNLTGLNSAIIGNMQLTGPGNDAVITSLGPNGNVKLVAGAAGQAYCNAPFELDNSSPIRFSNGVNILTIGIGNGLTQDFTYNLPPSPPTITNALLCTPAGNMSWGSISSTQTTVTKANHGYIVGNIIGANNTGIIKAVANNPATSEVIGIVVQVIDINNFVILLQGFLNILAGLTPGSVYFLNDDPAPVNAGTLTLIEPTIPGHVSKPLLMALSATSGIFNNQRGKIV